MSDYEVYAKMKEMSAERRAKAKDKKAHSREQSALLLTEAGIHHVTNNNGVHLIVEGVNGYIDFWPGTGRWKERNGIHGFGVKNLIGYIDECKQRHIYDNNSDGTH